MRLWDCREIKILLDMICYQTSDFRSLDAVVRPLGTVDEGRELLAGTDVKRYRLPVPAHLGSVRMLSVVLC